MGYFLTNMILGVIELLLICFDNIDFILVILYCTVGHTFFPLVLRLARLTSSFYKCPNVHFFNSVFFTSQLLVSAKSIIGRPLDLMCLSQTLAPAKTCSVETKTPFYMPGSHMNQRSDRET